MRVVTVLKTGGVYGPEHVERLAKMIWKHNPDADVVCLTDSKSIDKSILSIPLKHCWTGWWSKMELYGPLLEGDVFYMDLDTVVCGPLDSLYSVNKTTGLSDFYRNALLASGLLYIKEKDKHAIYKKFMEHPAFHMAKFSRFPLIGDQGFLSHFEPRFNRWQKLRPGEVVSYKVHIKNKGGIIPEGVNVVCFHGNPRPWQVHYLGKG